MRHEIQMKRLTLRLLAAVVFVIGAGISEAKAVSLSFQLSSSSATVGDTVTLSAVIGGLGDFTSPSLGVFDFNIDFDPSLVALTASPITFSTLLGDEGSGESLTGFSASTGSVNLFALSFLTASELTALQPSSFTLATLSFKAMASGVNPFTFSSVVLGDGVGDPLSTTLGSSVLTVNSISPPPPSEVPEPATLFLLGFGIAIMMVKNLFMVRNCSVQRIST